MWRCLDEAREVGVRKRSEGVTRVEFPDAGWRFGQREARFLRTRIREAALERRGVLLRSLRPLELPGADDREHPIDGERTRLGHSVGRWEGDTLVVDRHTSLCPAPLALLHRTRIRSEQARCRTPHIE